MGSGKVNAVSLAVASLTVVALLLRFGQLGAMPLFADEAYYLLWAGRLAPAYFDHPAGIAFLLRLSTLLGGHGEFGVRWLNALLSVACVPLSYAVGRRYVGGAGGLTAAAAMTLAPVYIMTGRVAYPDALHGFLLLANLLALAPILAGGAGCWRWVWFGATAALLLNVRLSSGFYLVGAALYLSLWRRDALRGCGPWLAVALLALGTAPLLAWNLAHDWAGVRWAFLQGAGFGFARPGILARAAHAWSYLTPPVVLLAVVAGAGFLAVGRGGAGAQGGGEAGRRGSGLLALAAMCLLAPVLLSAADNPRNLGIGLLLLWPLAGAPAAWGRVAGMWRRLLQWGIAGLLAWTAAFSAGTPAALLGSSALPHPQAAVAIRADAAGWPAFARDFAATEAGLVYAVDYSIAGQVGYYTGLTVHSSGGQFRVWGIPDADHWTVLSQTFILAELVTARLRADFSDVAGPLEWRAGGDAAGKKVLIWQARGRVAATSRVVDDLDYLSLARATR